VYVCTFQNVYGGCGGVVETEYFQILQHSMYMLLEISYINGPLGCVRLRSYIYPEYLFR
jgi:hypothetical protein